MANHKMVDHLNFQKNNEATAQGKASMKSERIIICRHCSKKIDHVKMIGISLVCPLCGKPQTGEPNETMKTSATIKSQVSIKLPDIPLFQSSSPDQKKSK